MITARIEDKPYKVCTSWADVTLEKFIELSNIEIPGNLYKLWKSAGSEDQKEYEAVNESLTDEELIQFFPIYYGKVIKALTTIPQKVIDRMDGRLRESFFFRVFRHYIFSLINPAPLEMDEITGDVKPMEPKKITSFTLGKVKYQLPASLKVYGEDVPLAEEKTITFIEASSIELVLRDLYEGSVKRLPMFCAIYCRPEGEEYDEKKVLAREKLFHKLRMDVVWEVFFCISELYVKFASSIQAYLSGVDRLIRETSKPAV